MFFHLAFSNSRRSRKENGLFFASLLISVVAFYMILSLSRQDVMLFLAKMESDAVDRLLGMIPVFYGLTLFLLFFLIYYASKFQLERRRHEFGVYLMMGMRRFKLFALLLAEDLGSSILALVIGLPAALLLSELISLVTAHLTGLGIIGHQVTASAEAAFWTAAGFLLIKLLAFLILSGNIAGQEIGALLIDMPKGMKKQLRTGIYAGALVLGTGSLAAAYAMAIGGYAWQGVGQMGFTLVLGILGTMLFFFGLRSGLGFLAAHPRKNRRLSVFNFRQIQEIVITRSNTLAVSSLLILAALCFFGAGTAIARFYGQSEPHVLDYTFYGEGTDLDAVRETLKEQGFAAEFSNLFEMKAGHIRSEEDYENAYQMDAVLAALKELPQSDDRDVLINNFQYNTYPYLISLSSYNRLLAAAGLPELSLLADEAAVYMDAESAKDTRRELLNGILKTRPKTKLAQTDCYLTGEVQTVNLVTDRLLTLSFALILPDEAFEYHTKGDYEVYLDAVLNRNASKKKSLLTAISDLNERLDQAGISYESYLQNMGRQLFYIVAASYITIYLAIMFFVIANTVIGVQYLMGQQKSRRRYQTLVRLGASYKMLCRSAAQQINWYFGIPAAVAACSSLFGVRSLLKGLLSVETKGNSLEMLFVSAAMIAVLCVLEYIYIAAVRRMSSRYLLTLMAPEREE